MLLMRILLFSIPEAAVVALLSISLLRGKAKWINVILTALFAGTMVFAANKTIGSFIINVLLLILGIYIGLSLSKVQNPLQRLIAVFLSVSIYFTIEFININVISIFAGLNPKIFEVNIALQFLAFLPQVTTMLFLSLYIRSKGLVLFCDEGGEGNEKALL